MSELAGGQWGVLSRAQLRDVGVASATVDYWVRAGRLHVVYRGVYAVGHGALRVEGRRLAAVLACGPGAVRDDQLERALAQAMYLRVYDQRAITDAIARSNGHRGTRVLTNATASEPKLTRSKWEIRMLGLVRGAGLPVPLTNEPFHAPDHGRCVPDFHWPAQRLIVETDGWDSHSTRAAFESDRAKDAALTAAGYRVVRFTWLTEDATIVRRLNALLA